MSGQAEQRCVRCDITDADYRSLHGQPLFTHAVLGTRCSDMDACSLRYAERYGYARGRADERADVAAWLKDCREYGFDQLATTITNGAHVGAAKKEGGQ